MTLTIDVDLHPGVVPLTKIIKLVKNIRQGRREILHQIHLILAENLDPSELLVTLPQNLLDLRHKIRQLHQLVVSLIQLLLSAPRSLLNLLQIDFQLLSVLQLSLELLGNFLVQAVDFAVILDLAKLLELRAEAGDLLDVWNGDISAISDLSDNVAFLV